MVGKYYDAVRPKMTVDKAKVARLRKQGLTFPVIGQRVGLRADRVAEICREMLSEEERAEILRKYGRDR